MDIGVELHWQGWRLEAQRTEIGFAVWGWNRRRAQGPRWHCNAESAFKNRWMGVGWMGKVQAEVWGSNPARKTFSSFFSINKQAQTKSQKSILINKKTVTTAGVCEDSNKTHTHTLMRRHVNCPPPVFVRSGSDSVMSPKTLHGIKFPLLESEVIAWYIWKWSAAATVCWWRRYVETLVVCRRFLFGCHCGAAEQP